MPAIAIWTIALLVVAGVIALLTLLAFGLGRASSRADDESERQMAEHVQIQREEVLAQAEADAETEVQAEAETELRAELAAKREMEAGSPQDTAPQGQGAKDDGVGIGRRR